MICLVPERQRAFFASYTSDPEGAPFDRVDSLLFHELGVAQLPAPAGGAMTPGAEAWDGWYAPRPTRFEQFAYLDAVGAMVRLRVRGDTMTLGPVGGVTRTLVGHAGRHWRLTERRSPTHVLLDDGRARLVSDGQRTLERVSTPLVWWRWFGMVIGVLALAMLVLRGGWRLLGPARGRTGWRDPAVWPTLAAVPVVVGVVGMLRQPFLAIGDPTWPSVLLAVGTGGLLVAVGAALVAAIVAAVGATVSATVSASKAGTRGGARRRVVEVAVLAGALQWLVTLALWGAVPLRLWG
jgi:hypothetical protein